eukprot:TRINITY_DN551_c3_g2_i3.p1 TRINITY_DN551_c3_g2~~TRINITY_DN551_c3_g2_i3.p1  ORF type:complete len:179 (+),score=78.80 TRINITY_DN551_c3_g2_i3:41-538(+)
MATQAININSNPNLNPSSNQVNLQQPRSLFQNDALKFLTQDYAACLLQTSHLTKREQKLKDSTEQLLLRLDELGHLVETVKAETTKTHEALIPALISNTNQLKLTMELIDQLEVFTIKMIDAVCSLEQRVELADSSYSALARTKTFGRTLEYVPGLVNFSILFFE